MTHHFTSEELQRSLEGLNENIRVTTMGTYNFLEYPEGLRIAMPALSQHVLAVPPEVMPLLHPGAIFGDA